MRSVGDLYGFIVTTTEGDIAGRVDSLGGGDYSMIKIERILCPTDLVPLAAGRPG